MNDTSILSNILSKLKEFTGANEAIFSDQPGKKPKYPYITLKLISQGGGSNQAVLLYDNIPSDNPKFQYDVEMSSISMSEISISVSAYSNDMDEALNVIGKCRQWFKFSGYDYLKSLNIVVVNIGTIQNRDSLLITNYERRQGFDVLLRTTEILKKKIETIEEAKIEKEV